MWACCWDRRERRVLVANLAGLRLFLCLGAALGGWQDPVLNWAVDSVDQLFQVCRMQLRRLAVLTRAAPRTSLDEAGLENLKLDELIVLRQPDVPLPVPLFASQSLKLYWRDIVHTCCCAKPVEKMTIS